MHESACYKNIFLTDVVARIDFVGPLPSLEKTIPARVSDSITKHFPIVEPAELVNYELQVNVNQADAKSNRSTTKQWQFFSTDRQHILSVSSQAIFILYKKYTTYEELKEQFTQAVEAVEKNSPDARAKRFGLRYINKVVKENSTRISDFSGAITESLLSTVAFFKSPEKLTRLFHIAELKENDLDVRFQFGFPNPDYPAALKRPEFILDLDAHVQTVHTLSESLRYMDRAHDQVQNLFEASITDTLRDKMNG